MQLASICGDVLAVEAGSTFSKIAIATLCVGLVPKCENVEKPWALKAFLKGSCEPRLPQGKAPTQRAGAAGWGRGRVNPPPRRLPEAGGLGSFQVF